MKRDIVLVFTVALLLRLTFSFFVQVRVGEDAFLDPEPRSDAGQYAGLAKNILSKGSFELYGEPHSFRTPGYPVWLAFWYKLSQSWFFSVAVIGSVVGSLVAAMTYYLGRALFSRPVGLIAGSLFALEPYGVHMAARPMTETVYALLIALLAVGITKMFTSEGRTVYGWGMVSGLIVGAAILVRPQMWPFFVPIAAVVIVAGIWRRARFGAGVVFICGVATLVMPWAYRNYLTFGAFDVSSQGGWNLYFYDAKRFTGGERWFGMSEEELRLWLAERLGRKGPDDVRSIVYQPIYYREAFAVIAKNPVRFALWHAKESLVFFTDDGLRDILRHAGVFPRRSLGILGMVLLWRIVWGALFAAAAYGMWRAWSDPRIRYSALFFALTILYVPAVGGTLAVARFRYPMTPMLFVLAAYGAEYFLRYARR